MSEKDDDAAAPAAKPKGALLIMAVLAALIVGGAGGMFVMLRRAGAPPPDAKAGHDDAKGKAGEHGDGEHGGGEHGGGEHGGSGEAAEGDDGPVVSLAPFVVNLLDESGETHYLKCVVAVELSHGGLEKLFEQRTPKVRNALLMYLGTLRVGDTEGIENKRKMLDAIRVRVQESVGRANVHDVFLTEFVIQ